MPLEEGESTVGRSRGCTVTLRDPSASRNHVLITIRPGEMSARDLQSSNGTYLNGERLTSERLLNDGDRITIGETDIFARIAAPTTEEVGVTVRLDTANLQCPACGAELPLHAEFCQRCGHRMGAAAAAAAGAYEPSPEMFDSPPPPPPAGAPAMPPPYVGDPGAAPMWAAPQPSPAASSPPPLPGPRELYDEPEAMQFEPPGEDVGIDDSEILPRISDDVFHAPKAPPPSGRGAGSGERRPALQPTPPPIALADVPLPSPPAPPYTAPAAVAAPPVAMRPAGFWIRWLAQVIDGIWILAVVLGPTLVLGGLRNPAAPAVASLLWVLVHLFLVVPCWAFFGATPGKAVLGLRVIGGKRRRGIGLGLALLRLCGWLVSAAIFGLGFLMVAFTRDKRGLHDHLAGTAVVRR